MKRSDVARVEAFLRISVAIKEVKSTMVADEVCDHRLHSRCALSGKPCLYNGTAPSDCPLLHTEEPKEAVG